MAILNSGGKQTNSSATLRLFLFSHPRTVSNLLMKLYSEHPDIQQYAYPYLYPHFHSPEAQTGNKEKVQLTDADKVRKERMKDVTYQKQLDELEQHIATTEAAGKIPWLKEHTCYLIQASIARKHLEVPRRVPQKPKMEDRILDEPEDKREQPGKNPYHDMTTPVPNPTILPDRLMKTLTPIFIIRHPAKQVGSFYNATSRENGTGDHSNPEFEMGTSFRFSRLVFDYFKSLYAEVNDTAETKNRKPAEPIVIDGDDLINDTEGLSQRFCALTGLDPAGVIYKWEKAEALDEDKAIYMGTLNESSGVLKNEHPEKPNIAKEAKKWEAEWGPEVAHALVQRAETMMADYDYLYQFRI